MAPLARSAKQEPCLTSRIFYTSRPLYVALRMRLDVSLHLFIVTPAGVVVARARSPFALARPLTGLAHAQALPQGH